MTRNEELAIERLLQQAADSLWAGLPGRLQVNVVDQRIGYRYLGWSSALFRNLVEHDIGLSEARCWRCPTDADGDWTSSAPRIIRVLLNMEVAHQRAFHSTAITLGLVKNDACRDLPASSLLIDRLLLHRLQRSGTAIEDVMAFIHSGNARKSFIQDQDEMYFDWNGDNFFVRHQESKLPIVSTWIDIGRAKFNGMFLEIPDVLPEVIITTAPGRRLGEIISTGITELDRRTILQAAKYDRRAQRGGWHPKSNTELIIEADLIQIGGGNPF